jgi:hypothetical protein
MGKGKFMVQIKSTLDLVLERTKNLTLTDEERTSLQRKELEGRIRGWVKKYLDGLMAIDAVQTKMASLPKNQRTAGRDILRSFVLENLAAQGDIGKSLDLLEGILEESREPYLAAVRNFQEALFTQRVRFLEALKAGLADREISGRAITPNLDGDDAWALFQEKALAEFRKDLALIGRDN